MTDHPLYTTTVTVTCPHCGRPSRKLLREVMTNLITLCNHCPSAIDISAPELRATIDAAVERAHQQQRVPAE